MSNASWMSQVPTSRLQYLSALGVTAALAFTLGVATGPLSRRFAPTTTAATTSAPIAVVGTGESAARVPYDAGWELYDGGFAGGPAPRSADRQTASVRRVPYEAGWHLYDGGFAGGPAPAGVARQVGGVGRVPYEAGWVLYDGGWAGGPPTVPPGTSTK